MKRYIYIIIGIIVVALIAIGLLFLFRGSSALSGFLPTSITDLLPSVGTQGSNSSGTVGGGSGFGTPTVGVSGSSAGQNGLAQNFNTAVSVPVLNYFVDAQGNITAIEPSGEVIAVSGSQSSTISSSSINDIVSTNFSHDGKKLLVTFGDPTNPSAAVLDITAKTWTALPQGLQSPQWSPADSYQIALLDESGIGTTALDVIDVTNPKKLGVTTLLSLNATDLSLRWVSKNQFILSDKPSIQTTGSAWLFNSQTKSFTPIIYEASGLETVWGGSTTTTGLALLENVSGQTLGLHLIDANGNDLHDLNFLTLPTKCVFNQETSTIITTVASPSSTAASSSSGTPNSATTSTTFLYCGVPSDSSQLSSAQLPDDYNDGVLFTSDKMIKLNTNTGDLTTLWDGSAQNIDATDLKIFNNTLYFVNRYDQKLYSLTLPQ
jgi:hypothetical protein